MAAPLEQILNDAPPSLDEVLAANPVESTGFNIEEHLALMNQALMVAKHGDDAALGATNPDGTLKQTFGANGPNASTASSGLGVTNADGSLRQTSGFNGPNFAGPLKAPPTQYPILQPLGPRQDLRFSNFEAAKTLLAPRQPGVYTGGDKMDLTPKVTPATMPSAFQQTAVFPQRANV